MMQQWPSRQELQALERRLAKAEQTIMRQETNIKYLQSCVDGAAMPAAQYDPMAALRNRSRSPRPMMPALKPMPANNGPVMSVEEFASQNGLDEKCAESLNNQQPEVQRHVIAQGPVEGRNPSAMVMSRIVKATSEILVMGQYSGNATGGLQAAGFGSAAEVTAAVEEFISNNGLDDKSSDALRTQTAECQAAVVGQGAVEGRNPSAMVMGRIAKFQRGDM
eukprot:CAMPEP_0171196236 /NCGR_PEP_ID=MMETSP0790-20130122/21799_1 /TAXON_ID=2925 /ORGANISM="Alexandrium catenella, Strain OF101" /LENGTH=220 /DNA_ID=CAMNT_0011661455 /DNA_START=70 /DNA_END=732 /DNA_ORIENTATION=+